MVHHLIHNFGCILNSILKPSLLKTIPLIGPIHRIIPNMVTRVSFLFRRHPLWRLILIGVSERISHTDLLLNQILILLELLLFLLSEPLELNWVYLLKDFWPDIGQSIGFNLFYFCQSQRILHGGLVLILLLNRVELQR